MEDKEGSHIWFLNRDVVVVRPAQAFVDWALSLEGEGALDALDVFASSNAFLIPEFDVEDDAWAWVSSNCETIFEYMLHDWSTAPEEWPQDRSWDEFERWFTYEHISMAWDLVDEPLSSDAPSEDEDSPDGEA